MYNPNQVKNDESDDESGQILPKYSNDCGNNLIDPLLLYKSALGFLFWLDLTTFVICMGFIIISTKLRMTKVTTKVSKLYRNVPTKVEII